MSNVFFLEMKTTCRSRWRSQSYFSHGGAGMTKEVSRSLSLRVPYSRTTLVMKKKRSLKKTKKKWKRRRKKRKRRRKRKRKRKRKRRMTTTTINPKNLMRRKIRTMTRRKMMMMTTRKIRTTTTRKTTMMTRRKTRMTTTRTTTIRTTTIRTMAKAAALVSALVPPVTKMRTRVGKVCQISRRILLRVSLRIKPQK